MSRKTTKNPFILKLKSFFVCFSNYALVFSLLKAQQTKNVQNRSFKLLCLTNRIKKNKRLIWVVEKKSYIKIGLLVRTYFYSMFTFKKIKIFIQGYTIGTNGRTWKIEISTITEDTSITRFPITRD